MTFKKDILNDNCDNNALQSFIVLCFYCLVFMFLSPFMLMDKLTGGTND